MSHGDGRKTGSRAEGPAAFQLDDQRVPAGSARTVEIPIARLPSGTFTAMPVVVSLRAAARHRGIRMLLYEGGEALRFDEEAIARGVDGALRVLGAMDMMADVAGPSRPPALARASNWTRAGRSGFCHARVELGETVATGQPVATISDSLGKKGLDVRSRAAGVVIGILRTALVHRGDALVHVAQVGASPG